MRFTGGEPLLRGDLVKLVRVSLKSETDMKIYFKSKGQRGSFMVHIHEDGSSTPKMPALLTTEVQKCHI